MAGRPLATSEPTAPEASLAFRFWQTISSLVLVIVTLPLLVLASPVCLPVLAVVDLVTGRRDLPLPRLYLFAIVFVIGEWVGQLCAFGIWLGRIVGRRDTFRADAMIQRRWANAMLSWARRLLRVRFELPKTATLPPNDFIVLSRHSSMIDAVVPMWVVASLGDRYVHYVLKRELMWVPNLRVYGIRLNNHFVTRGGDTAKESAAIEAMARNGRPNSAYVIFPEGTYSTEQNRQRVQRSLAKLSDRRPLEYAQSLRRLLPPKAAGTLALLRARPQASVLIFGHVGLAGLAELSGLRANLPLNQPVIVRWWEHERASVPNSDSAAEEWLRQRWTELDRWAADPPS